LSLGGNARALRSPSANALTGDNLSGLSIGAARDLGLSPLPGVSGVSLWAEAGLTSDSADGTVFQSMSTAIGELGLTGGLALRYHLHRLITASARASLGAQRVSLRVTDTPSSQSGSGWGAMAQASAAVDLVATSRPPFGIGLRAEFGYVAAQGVGMTLHRDAPGPSSPLGTTDLMLGHLDLGGPSFAVSLLGQF
ncbi:MAG TPA: hypothetical protein VF469_18095, partial [Kofleriaceae bacterium]